MQINAQAKAADIIKVLTTFFTTQSYQLVCKFHNQKSHL